MEMTDPQKALKAFLYHADIPVACFHARPIGDGVIFCGGPLAYPRGTRLEVAFVDHADGGNEFRRPALVTQSVRQGLYLRLMDGEFSAPSPEGAGKGHSSSDNLTIGFQ